jgi:hypothetical protein
MSVVPNLQVAFIDLGKIHLPTERFLQGAAVGHPKQNVLFRYFDKPLKNFFRALDVLQYMQAKNHIKARRRKGIGGDFRPDKIHGNSVTSGQPNALRVHVGSPHFPAVLREKGQ